ncbi:MAG: protein kinase [Myxococcales bacterium]|nr:protein kinase [Myxococcales bacterium]
MRRLRCQVLFAFELLMGTANEAKSNQPSHWSPPKSFDEYRLLWPLGRGGMGAVYLGHDMLLDRAVAIKFISAINPDSVSREQFLTEARAAARLQHPNVVTVYRVGEIEGRPYIIQEYLRGQSLERMKKPLPWQQVMELALGLSRGLATAHRRGVLHRDIKPGNVMLPTDGGVKLLDFGLAKLVDANQSQTMDVAAILAVEDAAAAPAVTQSVDLLGETMAGQSTPGGESDKLARTKVEEEAKAAQLSISSKSTPQARLRPNPQQPVRVQVPDETDSSKLQRFSTQNRLAAAFGKEHSEQTQIPDELWRADPLEKSSTIKGTPLYMAPEVFDGEPASRQSDLYSLGAVLFELCVGKPPHYNTSLLELHRMVTTTDAVPLASAVPTVDPRFAAIIDRCLLRNPAKRFHSADELREALEHLLPSGQGQAVPEGNPYRGLLPFESQHRALFFGRQSEIGTLVDRLRTESFVIVAADSGVGKSSVCRAGVLPLVKESGLGRGLTYQIATLVPGKQPLRTLCEAIAQAIDTDEQPLIAALKTDPQSFPRVLRSLMPPGAGLLIFVDQMEELVTIADPLEAKLVGEALGALSQKAGDLRLLGTVRADFVSRVATVPGIGEEINHGLYLLRPMGPDKLREAVIGPAQLKGVRFETEQMIDELVASTAESDAGLPLLQFALAELWDVRSGSAITAQALESIGGVMGALARHADHLIGSLPTDRRPLARRLLMTLVTIDGTRARRTADELTWNDPSARSVLELLVRGRLLVARETPEGAAYEVAHEALIKGWGTLRRWLEENAERRAVKHRLEQATQEWNRLHQSREALWSAKQLAELALLEAEDIHPKELAFVKASRAAMRRLQLLRRVALLMIPLLLISAYVGVQLAARRKLARQVSDLLAQAQQTLSEATQLDAETERLRKEAFSQFDQKHKDDGEKVWAQARKAAQQADRIYNRAAQILESALTLDAARSDVREQLAQTLYQRAHSADRDRQRQKRDDLLERMALYDQSGTLQARWQAPATLTLATAPLGAKVQLQRYSDDDSGRKILSAEKDLGVTPLFDVPLAPGSYLLTLTAAGRTEVRYPLLVARGEVLRLDVPLPARAEVPAGYVFVPKGRFLFGYGQDENLRKVFFGTAPLHEVVLDSYLIAQHETTFADWIQFLESLPPKERKLRMPSVARGALGGSVELKEDPGSRWVLHIQPQTERLSAAAGAPVVYPTRTLRKRQDWQRFPVGGITADDAHAYTHWLHQSGRLKGARLCTESEWERAAKGADERDYPHGDSLTAEDANFDETYRKDPGAMGPDVIGSHPDSSSPFGLLDLTGNHWEMVTSSLEPDGQLGRGGSYFFDALTCRIPNRNLFAEGLRGNDVTVRICASFSPGH